MAWTKTDDKMRDLQHVGLFAGCTKGELKTVAHLCILLPVEEGFVLTAEGAIGQECFVVAEGTARVTRKGVVVGRVGPGGCIGEMALLDRGTRTATVTAETPMSVYVFSVAEFWSVLAASPVVAEKIAINLARRLRKAESAVPPETMAGIAAGWAVSA
jgi:CRP-like cAMP-binding protein